MGDYSYTPQPLPPEKIPPITIFCLFKKENLEEGFISLSFVGMHDFRIILYQPQKFLKKCIFYFLFRVLCGSLNVGRSLAGI